MFQTTNQMKIAEVKHQHRDIVDLDYNDSLIRTVWLRIAKRQSSASFQCSFSFIQRCLWMEVGKSHDIHGKFEKGRDMDGTPKPIKNHNVHHCWSQTSSSSWIFAVFSWEAWHQRALRHAVQQRQRNGPPAGRGGKIRTSVLDSLETETQKVYRSLNHL